MSSASITTSDRIGFLGPVGTFTEEALLSQSDLAAAQLVPMRSFADILFAVAEGQLEYGFVAVENALEGAVNVTLDTLAFDVSLIMQREVVLPIEMNLLARPGTALSEITGVASFPHAYAQCRAWLRANLPEVEMVNSPSTAEAAEMVAAEGAGHLAAIANVRTAEVYGLEIIGADIAEHRENATRFVLVGTSGVPAPTGHDKTSVVVFQRADAPGSLLSILQEFAARRINLTQLLSRPTKTALGEYCFVLDLEGHICDEVVADCLKALKAKQADVKFLGSYPAAGADHEQVRHVAGAAERDAEGWMAGLRESVDES